MSEQIHDQVSAFMDDELSSEECAFLVRRLERDPEARSKFSRYALVGSVLRNELLQSDPQLLSRRIRNAVGGSAEQHPAPIAAAAAAGPRARWKTPALGAGIAATVAVAALLTVRAVNEAGNDARPAPTAVTAEATDEPAYVVPRDRQNAAVVAPPPVRLTNYLMHHGEYASYLNRTSVHSNVVAAPVTTPAENEPQ